jgi:hypothetical protein
MARGSFAIPPSRRALRHEARRLLNEALGVADPRLRKQLLARSFELIQRAEKLILLPTESRDEAAPRPCDASPEALLKAAPEIPPERQSECRRSNSKKDNKIEVRSS